MWPGRHGCPPAGSPADGRGCPWRRPPAHPDAGIRGGPDPGSWTAGLASARRRSCLFLLQGVEFIRADWNEADCIARRQQRRWIFLGIKQNGRRGADDMPAARRGIGVRSEERRVGKECRARWSADRGEEREWAVSERDVRAA